MSLFSELLNEVADGNRYPLDNCLLKAKLLASRLPGRKFRQWVDAELNGYPDAESAPDYRLIRASIYGHFDGPFGSAVRNAKLDISGWGEDVRSKVERFCFLDNVAGLRALLDTEVKSLRCDMDMNFITLYRMEGNAQIRGMILNDAHLSINTASVSGVLLAIRSRLLDFLLELRERHPELEQDDAAAGKVPEAEIARIVDQKIYHGCQFLVAGRDVKAAGDLAVAGEIESSFGATQGK